MRTWILLPSVAFFNGLPAWGSILDEGHGFSRAVNIMRAGRLQPLGYGSSLSLGAGISVKERTSGAKALTVQSLTARLKPCPS
jgi:hypothetical protein